MNFVVQFYETADGKKPVEDFLDRLPPKLSAKTVQMLQILEEKGTELRQPYTAPLEDGIFELRCKQGSDISRSLFFFYVGQTIVVTNGFMKKTQKTPRKEIELAKRRRTDYIQREEKKK